MPLLSLSKKSVCVCFTHLLKQTQLLVGCYRAQGGRGTTLHQPHPRMKGAQESRHAGPAPLEEKGTTSVGYTCTFWCSSTHYAELQAVRFFPPATPQRTGQEGGRVVPCTPAIQRPRNAPAARLSICRGSGRANKRMGCAGYFIPRTDAATLGPALPPPAQAACAPSPYLTPVGA